MSYARSSRTRRRIRRFRHLCDPRGLDRGQVEPRRHDDRVLHRHRRELDGDGACELSRRNRHGTVRDRRVRRDLPPRRPGDGGARPEEDRRSARDQRRVRQSRRRRSRAADGRAHRYRRMAQCVHSARSRLHRSRCRLRGVPLVGTREPRHGNRREEGLVHRGAPRPSIAGRSCGCSRSSCSRPRSAV